MRSIKVILCTVLVGSGTNVFLSCAVSPKDLKALQEQFSTLMLASTDTKIAANEFASSTGFRADSALVKYLHHRLQFLEAQSLNCCLLSRFLFGLLDLDKNGFITEVDFLCSMAFFMKGDKRERLECKFYGTRRVISI